MAQLMIQLEGILIICAWTGVATYLILKAINIFVDVRVSSEDEDIGLDVSEHNEQGYSL
jgi:Amt family ammonium transporter